MYLEYFWFKYLESILNTVLDVFLFENQILLYKNTFELVFSVWRSYFIENEDHEHFEKNMY
jgi:hypothetical protein